MSEATLSAKNQVVIPREARTALRLRAGDKLLFVVRGNTITVLKKPRDYWHAIRGLAKRSYPARYLEKERRSWD
jgi:AbrB family looped-hinge helix DNA binding protein